MVAAGLAGDCTRDSTRASRFFAVNSRADHPGPDERRQNVEFRGKLLTVFLLHGKAERTAGSRLKRDLERILRRLASGPRKLVFRLHKPKVTERFCLGQLVVSCVRCEAVGGTGLPRTGGLLTIPELIQSGFFSESALHGFLQVLDGAPDRLIHSRLVVRDDDGLAAIAARLDRAALVVVSGLVADGVAEMHIYPPDAVAKTVQRSLDDGFHLV